MNFDNRLGPYRIKMLELARYSGRSSVSASRRPRKKAYPPPRSNLAKRRPTR